AAYWFTLQQAPLQVSGPRAHHADPAGVVSDALPALLVGVDWQNVLDGGTRAVLERQALRPFLERQRWFGAKSRAIRTARFSDWTAIRTGSNPAFIAIVNVDYDDGWTESYVLPLSLISRDAAERAIKETPNAVLAKITGARKGAIVDGMRDDDDCDRLMGMVGEEREIASTRGSVRGIHVGLPVDVGPDRRWTRGSGDQSNSVAFVDDRYVLKLFRRIEPGPNPEFE